MEIYPKIFSSPYGLLTKSELLFTLCTEQNWKCCLCGSEIEYPPSVHQIMKPELKNWEKSYVICRKCRYQHSAKRMPKRYYIGNRSFTPYQYRRLLAESQGWRCCYCGCIMNMSNVENPQIVTVEHIISRVDGGRHDWINTVAACRKCNAGRPKGMSALDYYDKIREKK